MTRSPQIESDTNQNGKKQFFVSLRIRLLVGFTIIFTGVFTASYFWFYTFTINQAVERTRKQLNDTLQGVAAGVDVEELLDLYETGQPNAEGFSDDPRYRRQLDWLATAQQLEPQAWPYAYRVVGEDDSVRRLVETDGIYSVETGLPSSELEVIGLVDLWALHDRRKSYLFLDTDEASQYTMRAWNEGVLVERPDLYEDDWGQWFTSYMPLKNEAGETVAMIGLDIEASYITALKRSIGNKIVVSFSLSYGTLFFLIYGISSYFTRPLKRLNNCAEKIANAEYDEVEDLVVLSQRRLYDEFGELAKVFSLMITKVKGREQALKTQVQALKIEIDHARKEKELTEIVETEFFQDLQAKALAMRRRKNRGQASSDDNPSAS